MRLQNTAFVVFLSLCVALTMLASPTDADLPVHCLAKDIVGDWIIHGSLAKHGAIPRCHHYVTAKLAEMKIRISEPNVVEDFVYGTKGTWTMVADEGIEIKLGGKTLFAFFKWRVKYQYENSELNSLFKGIRGVKLKPHMVKSECHHTHHHLGWYNTDATHWGCFFMNKVASHSQGMRDVAYDFDSSKEDVDMNDAKERESIVPEDSEAEAEIDSDSDDSLIDESDTMYVSDPEIAEHINAVQDSWTAKTYPEFEEHTVAEIRKMLGGKQHFDDLPGAVQSSDRTEADADIENAPAELDWTSHDGQDYVGAPRQQGHCGSCYCFASMAMFESRLRVMTKNEWNGQLSPQDVLNCNPFAQGCHGGFAYSVSKFAHDAQLIDEKCAPYKAITSTCASACATPAYKVKAGDYGYVGGYFGACSEAAMIAELQHGPLAVGLRAYPDLLQYEGGVYRSQYGKKKEADTDGDDEGDEASHNVDMFSLATLKPWEKTTHTVLLVGYGVTPEGQKYWKIRNSWGENWGEKGFFRIVRGEDHCAVESAAIYARPTMPEK